MPKVAIFVYGFSPNVIRLQPWRWVYEVAKRIHQYGGSSTIITDSCVNNKTDFKNISIRDNIPLSPVAKASLINTLKDISPNVILWPLGPKSLAYIPLFKTIGIRIIGYFPGPILKPADFYSACLSKLPKESALAAMWLLARIMKWGKRMSSCCEKFIVLSEENRQSLIDMGIDEGRIHIVTAGRDIPDDTARQADISRLNWESNLEKTALFMGWPIRVRGIDLLLKAFEIVSTKNVNLHLKILARGENTKDHKRLHTLIEKHKAKERIKLIDGFLPEQDVVRHIAGCDFGVLPFVQVPADRPLSFLEFFSAGKPVVTTDASGLPELIGEKRGKAAKRFSPGSLADAMEAMASMSDSDYKKTCENCITYSVGYPDWDNIAQKFMEILNRGCNEPY